MAALIDTIILPDTMARYRCGSSEWRDMRLGPLGKINIFVGANNTGKSWAMRMLCEANLQQNALPRFEGWRPPEVFTQSNINDSLREFERILAQYRINPPPSVITELEQVKAKCSKSHHVLAGIEELRFLALLSKVIAPAEPSLTHDIRDTFHEQIHRAGWGRLHGLTRELENFANGPEIHKLYIPTLRTLRHVGIDAKLSEAILESISNKEEIRKLQNELTNLFQQITKRQYFTNSGKVSIFTGQTLYSDIENLVRGDLKSRKKLTQFEAFLAETFFQGKPVALIPRKDHDEVTIKIGNEQERPIHQLGDGIQMLLLLTYPLFQKSSERVLAFIEEPELFLHPWLQRVFIELLASNRFPNHQYFLTTHSNHLLDLVADVQDVSIFSFEKEGGTEDDQEHSPQFRISNISREDRKPLDLLGVRNSSVLLSNCTVWVEGITDRRYLAHWLELYQASLPKSQQKIFREDLHFSFVEYGGGNITHWSFLDNIPDPIDVQRLCGKLFLITDKDSGKVSKKAERHKKLEKHLKDRYCCLTVREIENLLLPTTIRAVLESYGEKCEEIPAFNHKAYKDTALGTFLEKALSEEGRKKSRSGSYCAQSGTITDKVKFCEYALKATNKWEDVSPEAQELVIRLYGFIKENNQST